MKQFTCLLSLLLVMLTLSCEKDLIDPATLGAVPLGNLEGDLIIKINPDYQHNGAVNQEILAPTEAADRISAFVDGGVEGVDYLQRISGDYTLYADEDQLIITSQEGDDVQIITFNVTSHNIPRDDVATFLESIGIPVNIANELLDFIYL